MSDAGGATAGAQRASVAGVQPAPVDPLVDWAMLRAIDEGWLPSFVLVPREWPRLSPKTLPAGYTYVAEVRDGKLLRGKGIAPAAEDVARALAERESAKKPNEGRYVELLWVANGHVTAGGTSDLRRAIAPVDTPEKAVLLLEYGHARTLEWQTAAAKCVACDGRFVRRTRAGGFEIVAQDVVAKRGPCPQSDRVVEPVLVLFEVASNGMVVRRGYTEAPRAVPLPTARGVPCIARDSEGSGRAYEAPSSAGEYVAQLAHDEAISIESFRRLARELEAAGAPATLVERARSSARDEARHARMMARLARELGARVRRTPAHALAPRSFDAWVLENAIEGCARETYSAVVAAYQAKHAPHAGARRAFSRIAKDEAEHARLAWDIQAWASRVTPARSRSSSLGDATHQAFDDLEHAIVARDPRDFVLGWEPPPEVAVAIVHGLRARIDLPLQGRSARARRTRTT
ncbi:MAG: ferritin [Myxococcaceae bacterium]|nr:ferritin [Myxococcaceae bacterium]